MGKINWGRVFLGGLLAGVVINAGEMVCGEFLLKAKWDAAMAAIGVTMPTGARAMTIWVLYGFVVGIAGVFLYAAIRPRFGAGVKTAVTAGVFAWVMCYALWCVSLVNMGLFPASLMVPVAALGLVELLVAVVAGAWLYQES